MWLDELLECGNTVGWMAGSREGGGVKSIRRRPLLACYVGSSASKERKGKLHRQGRFFLHQLRHWLKRAGSPLHHKAGKERASGDQEGCWKHPTPEPSCE
eukprot:scaffold96917_cov24-Tisochrysis_lutea.AAC.1